MDDRTVVCQVDYAENFGLADQNQVQSIYWSTKYISIFTAYVWMGSSDGEGQAFGLVSNSTQHDKYSVITCLEILINEIISMMPDVSKIILFSDNASSQFKNRYIIHHLTTILDAVGDVLKRLVWLEILSGKKCSSAEDFVRICYLCTASSIRFNENNA